MSKKCPKCGSNSIMTERRLDGFHHCMYCRHSWEIGASQPKQTVFHRITASPEVLAEKLVYQTEDEFGDVTWSSTIVSGWYVGREDCIAATVARLKEVCVEQNAVDYTQPGLCSNDHTQKDVGDEL